MRRIRLGKKKINFSQVFAGQAVGIKEVHDDIWLVSFMDYDLGYFDPSVWVGPLIFGGPGGTRTPDNLLRRQILYPAELRAHAEFTTANKRKRRGGTSAPSLGQVER
jgi:hypothetical protein